MNESREKLLTLTSLSKLFTNVYSMKASQQTNLVTCNVQH